MIAAPVFGPAVDAMVALALLGFPSSLRGEEIARYGRKVRDAGLVATRLSRGRAPRPKGDDGR